MRVKIVAAAVALLFSSAAFAMHCPADMKKIDEAMAKKPKMTAAQMAEVKKHRAEGEALHKAGKHQESVDTLGKAMKILNIKYRNAVRKRRLRAAFLFCRARVMPLIGDFHPNAPRPCWSRWLDAPFPARVQCRYAIARAARPHGARARRARAARPLRRLQKPRMPSGQLALPSADAWFAAHGWQPFAFQREVWRHIAGGPHRPAARHHRLRQDLRGLVRLLARALRGEVRCRRLAAAVDHADARAGRRHRARAAAPLADLGLAWSVGVRTGDTESGRARAAGAALPEVLVTTPEIAVADADTRDEPRAASRACA